MRDTSEWAIRTKEQGNENGYWVIVNGISEASRRSSEGCLSFLNQRHPRDREDWVRAITIFLDLFKRQCCERISNGYKVYLVDGHEPKEATQLALGAIDAGFCWFGPDFDAKKADWPRTKDPPTPEDEFVQWIVRTGFPQELIRKSFNLPSIRKGFESKFQKVLEEEEARAERAFKFQVATIRQLEKAKSVASKKLGRRPKFPEFAHLAGNLWFERERADSKIAQLRKIASELDAKGYKPPAKYLLEKKYAEALRAYNRDDRHKSVKTWVQLVATADKDLLYGMRRLLSRYAGPFRTNPPDLSGN